MRFTHDGQLIEAPAGTTKCARTVGRPHRADWVHALFAPGDSGPMVQLMTRCGRRAHRLVLESEDRDVDCPACAEALAFETRDYRDPATPEDEDPDCE
jgi:hypothetical protein